MNAGRFNRMGLVAPVVVAGIWMAFVVLALPAAQPVPATAPTTRPSTTIPVTQPVSLGPDVVVLKELAALYEPVPFDHKTHAQMAQMWDGCMTCHHRTPEASTRPSSQPSTQPVVQLAVRPVALPATHPSGLGQESSASVPACKSCHAVGASEADIRMPNLKGAYHRQCLNCHKEWMHGNACVICHKPKGEQTGVAALPPTRDDIVGRMHPPIAEPEVHQYKMRYTPADGGNVLFRHKEHTADFGLRCVACHRRDNCSHCHDPKGDKTEQKPVHPGLTWAASHGPCMSCHQQDRCQHCHYKDDQPPPAAFRHAMTGQTMDKDHVNLTCPQCHAVGLKLKTTPTCGDSSCHKEKGIAFPAKRPGLVVTTQPTTLPTTRRTAKVRPSL